MELKLCLRGTPKSLSSFLLQANLCKFLAAVATSYGEAFMSASAGGTTATSTTFTLTNAADPSKATRFLDYVDLTAGETLPTFTSSNPSLLTTVVGTFTPADPTASPPLAAGVKIAAYPIDASEEADDTVLATLSLLGNPDITISFDISGTPPAPGETDVLEQGVVAPWADAPTVPTSPQ